MDDVKTCLLKYIVSDDDIRNEKYQKLKDALQFEDICHEIGNSTQSGSCDYPL